MKTNTLTTTTLFLTLLASPIAFAAGDHEHGHSHKHDDHSKLVKGPNGGHVVTSKAGFSFEVATDKDRKARIVFLDKDKNPVALDAQTITGIAGERSAPTKLTFNQGKDAHANVLVSDKPIPAGDHIPMILTIKTSPDAKPVTERFELHLH